MVALLHIVDPIVIRLCGRRRFFTFCLHHATGPASPPPRLEVCRERVRRSLARTSSLQRSSRKVDPDTVLLPSVLRQHLVRIGLNVPVSTFLLNCPNVPNGFYGSIELISRMATDRFLANMDNCKAMMPYGKGWGEEPRHSPPRDSSHLRSLCQRFDASQRAPLCGGSHTCYPAPISTP